MAQSFGGKSVPEGTTGELGARSSVTAMNAWFARRSVWVKVVSRSSACGQYKTLSSLKDQPPYEGGYNGSRPHPIITGVKIGSAGSLGTIREATINMIAFTKTQLDELEECYLIPKMSVMVIFGWSVGANGGTPGTNIGGSTDQQVICNIKNSGPLMDGVQGRVAKYDVTFNKDGMWWEINVKLVSASNSVLAAPAEDYTNTCECDTVSAPTSDASSTDAGKPKKAEMSALKGLLANLCEFASKGVDSVPDITGYEGGKYGTYAAELNNKNRWKSTLMEDAADFVGGLIPDFVLNVAKKGANAIGIKDTNPWSSIEAYISIDGICKAWETLSCAQADGKSVYGSFDNSKAGKLKLPPGSLQSSNPHKALFPSETYKNLSAPSCVENGGCSVGKILVNTIFAHQCLEDCGKQATFEDFISKILQGVNDASGGLWELTITDVGSCDQKTPTFSILDLQAVESVAPTNIPISPTSAVVREVTVALKMTDAMQTQALYGGVKQGTKDQACDDKRFKNLLKDYKNEADPVSTEAPKGVNCDNYSKIGCKKVESTDGNKFTERLEEMREDTGNPDLFESCYAEQVKMNNGGPDNVPSQCKNVILPYEFGFTVDGVGGFDFGQMVTSNVLPQATQDLFVYQIIAVEHDVTHGDWKTSVKTVPRYK